MSSGKLVICWDTSIILAWANGEDCHPLDEIGQLIRLIEENKIILQLPVSTLIETFTHPESEKLNLVREFIRRPSVVPLEITLAVAWKAAELRRWQFAQTGKSLKIGDCIAAASAACNGAHVLHAVDKEDLLKLDGNEILGGLRIMRPSVPVYPE